MVFLSAFLSLSLVFQKVGSWRLNMSSKWLPSCQFVMGMDEVIHALEFLPSLSAKSNNDGTSKNMNNDNNDVVSAVIHHSSPGMYKCVY
jgi:hypothetical protein